MKTLLYIYNPMSGKGQAGAKLQELLTYYTQNGYLVTIYPTFKENDTAYMVRDYLDKYDLVICAGGDGTLHEAINGYEQTSKARAIGYIPMGTTNDFAKNLNIPQNYNQAMKTILNGRARQMDIGKFNEESFIYVAAFGVFTDIPYRTPQKQKNLLGHAAYMLQSAKSIGDIKGVHAIVEYDGNRIEGEYAVGLITNSASIAGFKSPVSDDVNLADGLFEMILIEKPANLIEAGNLVGEMLSGNLKSDKIFYAQASEMTICSDPVEWTLDGEFGGMHDKVKISVVPNAIKMIVEEESEENE